MPGIPPAPTREQFDRIAKAIDPHARVVSTRKLTGGIASRMDVVELDGIESPRQVVTRQYYVDDRRAAGQQARCESTTLRVLAANGVPAPEVIIGEEAADILGRPAIVMSYLDGLPDLTPADPHDWARQLARAIAQYHAIEVPDALASLLRADYDSLFRWMDAEKPPGRFVKHELGVKLWDAMRHMWPRVDRSARKLLHTDIWPGNTVWNDGHLLAIVDWEWPGIGEPSSDVAYFLGDAAYSGFDIEQTFIEEYENASNRPVKDLLFWKMTAAARAMPDVGPWAQGYAELGLRKMTADDIRRAHSNYVQNLLTEFHSNA